MLQQNNPILAQHKVCTELPRLPLYLDPPNPTPPQGLEVIPRVRRPPCRLDAGGNGPGFVKCLLGVEEQLGLRVLDAVTDPFPDPEAVEWVGGVAVGHEKDSAAGGGKIVDAGEDGEDVVLSRESGQVAEEAEEGQFGGVD